ncbi:hypothetical protein U91I_02345 [alpha proteobacterium U9-1i]|nr:hypothetical protein U91I_02345 [alpha proteobacterium U9-1i]
MRLIVAALACVLAACQSAPTPDATTPPPFTLIDLTQEYAAFYDRTQGMESAARVEAFKAEMAPLFPGFYDTERVRSFATAEVYNGLIARSFEGFAQLRPRYETTAAGFEAMLAPARADFMRTFPDLAPIGDIYLLHSVGEMDGGIRTIDGKRYMVFGADVMARLYTPGDERPFFQHELFHVYHGQFFDTCDEVRCGLWREGLAVYVSERLNPGATDAQMGLTMPRPIRPEVDANLAAAVCAVRSRLGSDAREDYAPLFLGQASLEGLPPRFAYYVGYLVAREAGRTRTLQDLAHMRESEARPVIEAALDGMARCES